MYGPLLHNFIFEIEITTLHCDGNGKPLSCSEYEDGMTTRSARLEEAALGLGLLLLSPQHVMIPYISLLLGTLSYLRMFGMICCLIMSRRTIHTLSIATDQSPKLYTTRSSYINSCNVIGKELEMQSKVVFEWWKMKINSRKHSLCSTKQKRIPNIYTNSNWTKKEKRSMKRIGEYN